jgi:hypothetical protein
VLNGVVNPHEAATTYQFEYGRTTGYGGATSVERAGEGTANIAVQKEIVGLEHGEPYHFRIVASNREGTTYSPDREFLTLRAPPLVVTEGADHFEVIGETGNATLHGKVNPEGTGTEYRFEWGTEPGSFTHIEPMRSAGQGTSYQLVEQTISGLLGERHYYYRLFAQSNEGETAGGEEHFETPNWSPTVKAETATQVVPGTYKLSGKINPEGFGTHYRFEWGTSENYGSSYASPTELTGTSEVPVSHEIAGLKEETTYYFRIVGESSEGSGEAKGTFKTPRWKPTIVKVWPYEVGTFEPLLKASINPNGTDTHYYFEYSNGTRLPKEGEVDMGSEAKAQTVSQRSGLLSPKSSHIFKVVAHNSWGTVEAATFPPFETPDVEWKKNGEYIAWTRPADAFEGTLTLTDKIFSSEAGAECGSSGKGSVGTRAWAMETSWTLSCRPIGSFCSSVAVELPNLPWQGELAGTIEAPRYVISENEGETAAFKLTCQSIAGKLVDECRLKLNPTIKNTFSGVELSFYETFSCSLGSSGSASLRLNESIALSEGGELRVAEASVPP